MTIIMVLVDVQVVFSERRSLRRTGIGRKLCSPDRLGCGLSKSTSEKVSLLV